MPASRLFGPLLLGMLFVWPPAVLPAAAQPAGSVAGVVVDSFGQPLAGVSIEAVSASGYRSLALTQSGGRFQFSDLVPGIYALAFTLDGYAPAEARVEVTAGITASADARLAALQPSALGGVVVDPQGLALPGALVEATGPSGNLAILTADTTGRYSLVPAQPGRWRLRAALPGFVPQEASVDVVFAEAAAVTLSLPLDYALAENVVVVGSRRTVQQRTVTDSAVPVDVLTAAELVSQPRSDMVEVVRALTPSFNVNTQPISDAATIVRPVNLRNLAPDHLLLLVNGKRRHRGAVIAWLGNGISDGSQGPDLSVIPAIAVRQAELLRDGAAAQYGSDAIAGVVNFQLKDAREGGTVELRSGFHPDANTGDPATCGPAAGGASCNAIGGRAGGYSVAANTGLPLGHAGFANLSLEYGAQSPSNRATQREDARQVVAAGGPAPRDTAQVWGSPMVEDDLKLFGNFGALLASGLRPYGHANYASRRVTGGFYFRHPHTRAGVFRGPIVDGAPTLLVGDRAWARTGQPGAGNCPAIPVVDHRPDPDALGAVEADPDCFTLYSRFPGGFTPQFGGVLADHSVVAGVQGLRPSGFSWDASVSLGRSHINQFIFDTVNASLGDETPNSFLPGSYEQRDTNFNFDLAAPLGSRLHVAAGAERRTERFSIRPGNEASWRIGPYAEQGFSSGSNGFTGYRPDTTAGTWARSSLGVYGDVELAGLDSDWTLGGALRYERFEDFGATLNGKLSARRALGPALSVRGAVSTGFRAPTLGQQHTFNVTTAFIDGELLNNGVVPATSAVAISRGGRPLQPETSRNYSAGVVHDRGSMQLTADFFRIDVGARLALSQEIRLRPDEIAVLLAEGIAEARNFPVFRFFLNDFSTTTEGLDVLWAWQLGGTSLRAGWNHTLTRVRDIRTSVIDEFRVATLEQGLPQTRWQAAARHDTQRWRLLSRLHWYGAYWDSEDGRNAHALGEVLSPWLYPAYAGRLLVDAELGLPVAERTWLSVGAENLFNRYPEENAFGPLSVGNRYGQFAPFGFNGAYYYARLSYAWGGE